jgi:Ca2+-binding RTX toxin-like protein
LFALTLGGAQAGSYFPPPPDSHPVWSPDASTIAYWRQSEPGGGLRVVHPDGTDDRLLAGVPSTPNFAFSPDWKLLAVVVYSGTPNAADLEVLRPEQSEPRVIATNARANQDPAFSPDSTRIAYAASDGVWTIGADGSAPQRIATGFAENLAWSPDGTKVGFDLIFTTSRVYVARADGSGMTPAQAAPSTGASWSLDGRTLSYFASQDGTRIWTEIDGKATSYPIRGWSGKRPLWSTGGTLYYNAGVGIYRLDLVSGASTRIGPAAADVALSPDGSRFAYAASGVCADRVGIYVRSVAANASAGRLTNDCHIYGTDGPDHLVSSNQLFQIVDGRGGSDVIVGRGAAYVGDALLGGPGNDVIRGDYWPERLEGGPGDDTIYGGVNRDTLIGGPGHDRLYGQGGTDTIYARDGERDLVDCGRNTGKTNTTPERDTAYVDRFDVVKNCERVHRTR